MVLLGLISSSTVWFLGVCVEACWECEVMVFGGVQPRGLGSGVGARRRGAHGNFRLSLLPFDEAVDVEGPLLFERFDDTRA